MREESDGEQFPGITLKPGVQGSIKAGERRAALELTGVCELKKAS